MLTQGESELLIETKYPRYIIVFFVITKIVVVSRDPSAWDFFQDLGISLVALGSREVVLGFLSKITYK